MHSESLTVHDEHDLMWSDKACDDVDVQDEEETAGVFTG